MATASDPSSRTQPEDRFEQVLAEYLQLSEEGDAPDRLDFLNAHPQFRPQLEEFFADRDHFARLVGRVPPGADGTPGGSGETRAGSSNGLPDAPGAPVQSASAPTRFGAYELHEELGRGGMGVVFRATHVRLRRTVALKMVLSGRFATRDELQRFQLEAQNAAALDHPNIVPIYEVGAHQGQHYFTMKLVDGGSLAARIAHFAGDRAAAAGLMAITARAVHYAHQRAILHRDLKPANILIDADGRPQVTDFGLARRLEDDPRLTHTGALLGSPRYMAPEQAAGEKALTVATDVYALGAVLYELLTGRPPFTGDGVADVLRRVRETEPVRPGAVVPDLDPDLETVTLKCLAKEPARRYPSALALADDLERWGRGEAIGARPAGRIERGWRWCRRNKTVAGLLAALAVVAICGTVAVTRLWLLASRREGEALTALERETRAGARLREALRAEQLASYVRGVILADREITAGHLDRAQRVLDECPVDPRGWEWEYLRRQCHRDLLTLRWDARRVNAVAVSPDGTLIAAPGGDLGRHAQPCEVRIWDASTGAERFTLRGHDGGVFNAAFSPDGKRLATAGNDGTLRIWDVSTGALLADLRHVQGKKPDGPTGYQLLYAAWSPDGSRVATAGWKGDLIVWDVAARQEVLSIPGHTGYVYCVAYSPDGAVLASSGKDRSIRLWNASTGAPIRTIEGHEGDVYGLAWGPDGKRLATAASDGTARVWHVASGRELCAYRGHADRSVNRVAFSPDGARVASASGTYGSATPGEVKVWDARTGRELLALVGHPSGAVGVDFTRDGSRLASVSSDGTLKVWDAQLGQGALTFGGGSAVGYSGWPLTFSRDGRTLAVSDGTAARLWDVSYSRTSRPLTPPEQPADRAVNAVDGVALSGDGALLAIAGETLTVREVATGRALLTRGAKGEYKAQAVAFAPDGSALAVLHRELGITLLDPRSGAELRPPIPVAKGPRGATTTLSVARPFPAGGPSITMGGPAQSCLAFSRDGQRLAVGSPDGSVVIWSWRHPERPGLTIRGTDPTRPVNGLAFSPDGECIAGACNDGAVRAWDANTGDLRRTLNGHVGAVFCVAFTPDGQRIASGGLDQTVKLWHTGNGQEVLTLQGPGKPVTGISFTPDGRRLACHASGTVRIWNVDPLGR